MPTANKQVTKNNYYPPQSGDLLEEFENNHPTYRLFKEKGLNRDSIGKDVEGKDITTVNRILDDGLFRRLRRDFLNKVDLSKGAIERRVIKLERRRDLNPETRKMQEYLVTHVEWLAKDYLDNDLVSTKVLEGMHNKPLTQTTIIKGKRITQYQNWQPVYDIPFSKEAVNDALENQVNSPEIVKYMVRTSQSNRDDTYSLEQFRDSTFEECQEISRQGKGLNR